MRNRHSAVQAICVGLAFMFVTQANPVSAGPASPKVHGQSIGDWGLAWWQWVLNFPTASNPNVQNGPIDCDAGQSGAVWFLAGNFGGALGEANPAVRSCTVKKGKALFFPLLNGVFWTPEDCADEEACRTGVSVGVDAIISWTCTVDGVACVRSVPVVRAQSAAKPLNLPEGSIAVTDFGYAAGLRPIAVADGYWVMLDPLPSGSHTIHFTAAGPGFSLDVSYTITVK
jgi:hypothetical protein